MNKLIVRHLDGSLPAQFHLVRLSDGKSVGPFHVPSPVGFPVEGLPHSHLMRELRWYLELFLDHPFPPFTGRADRIQAALESWGTQAFDAMFGNRSSGRLFDAATSEDYSSLHLEISSDDPTILYWPWEALRDSEVGVLARTCQIGRRLNKVRDPHPLSPNLPTDCVNVLLVTARPYPEDVRYRSISRPLIDLIANSKLPANVTLLRPPTFAQLRSHLRAHPDHYHILHFDGHGAYGDLPAQTNPHSLTMQGPQGQLIFEDEHGQPDALKASVLSELLREYNVPVVVLNACQSAMVDDQADNAFASVAAGLQKSGVRSVVAMAYSLYVSGAQQFLPAFYQRLFETGNVTDAVLAGRQQTFARPNRVCARGEFPLDDWLVPVLYEQDAVDLSFASTASPTQSTDQPNIPAEASDSQNPYGFVGRDGPLLQLERAMHRPPAGILIHGLGGIGKTTLSRGFVQWLASTNGLGHGCFWFSFQDIRTAESVFNEMVGTLFGTKALAESFETKLNALIAALRENRFLIVWDNFEVVCGMEGTSLQSTLSADDRQRLLTFLKALRGGQTKVVITSRSQEDWLDPATCFHLSIGGLTGEERWEYCDAIVRDLGLTVDRSEADWVKLMELLDGHPLAMRVMLPRLQNGSPALLITAIEGNLLQFAGQDDESSRLFATLRFVQEGLPTELQRLLIPLALHDRFVDADDLKTMCKQATEPVSEADVDRLMQALSVAGLLRDVGNGIHELHPALCRYLQLTVLGQIEPEVRDQWWRLFVGVMGRVADHFAPRELHEQRGAFHVHGSNFRRALTESARLGMDQHFAALTQSLAAYAQNTRSFGDAGDLLLGLAENRRENGDARTEAGAYHQLGMIAEEQRDLAQAERWYRKSLAIAEKQGNEHGAAQTYHQLGINAQKQRDFAQAEQWYRKALAIDEKQGNEHGAAQTYHQLGNIAYLQRDLAQAEQWYRKSLAIEEKQGNEHGAAQTYHQLGIIAQEQRDFAQAEQWYRKALAIDEKQGNEHGAAQTYHQLGIIAAVQRDFAQAEQWYRKSLAIKEKQGNEHGAAITWHQLGIIAHLQQDFAQAGQWSLKAIPVFARTDPHNAEKAVGVFVETYAAADEATQAKLKQMWDAAGLGPFPEQDEPTE